MYVDYPECGSIHASTPLLLLWSVLTRENRSERWDAQLENLKIHRGSVLVRMPNVWVSTARGPRKWLIYKFALMCEQRLRHLGEQRKGGRQAEEERMKFCTRIFYA